MTISDVPINDLITKTAEQLKKDNAVKPPVWAFYAKTGVHKERPPADNEWWYVRSAAVLRSVWKLGPIGVAKLKKKYGGRKNRGHKPDRYKEGSGSVLRKVLQQLEKSQLVKKVEVAGRKGRVITGKGQSMLDKAAITLKKKQ